MITDNLFLLGVTSRTSSLVHRSLSPLPHPGMKASNLLLLLRGTARLCGNVGTKLPTEYLPLYCQEGHW